MSSNPISLFQEALAKGASDVHIAAGAPVQLRIDGTLTPQGPAMDPKAVEAFVASVLTDQEMERLTRDLEIDVAYALPEGTRLRVNCHHERGNLGLVARVIPTKIPTLEELDLAAIGKAIGAFRDGLVLFTGPTGAGKSTSLAALLQHLMAARALSVVTLEDPIEFLFSPSQGLIRQRQFGQDFTSFPEALKRVLRQDPDVVMVGEMRDPETVAAALTLAETGHLILATLHTPNAVQTIDRIIDVFPPHQQPQIRSQLSLSLKAVVAQRLLPKKGGGRVANREVLFNTPAVGNIIRDSRLQELRSVLQTGGDAGMITFEKDEERLRKEGEI